MSINKRYHTDRAKFSLELTMRDALEGLAELAYMGSAWARREGLEILSIEPATPETQASAAKPIRLNAAILTFPELRRRAG